MRHERTDTNAAAASRRDHPPRTKRSRMSARKKAFLMQWRSIVLFAVMMLAAVLGGAFLASAPAQAAGTIDVVVDFEGYNLGQGFYSEPTLLQLPEGATVAEAAVQLMGDRLSYTGSPTGSDFYMQGVRSADTGVVNIPFYITANGGPTTQQAIDRGNRPPVDVLGEFDYSTQAGWMYTVNNVSASVGAGSFVLHDNDVVRWQFTVWGLGRDLGVPTFMGLPFFTMADKTELMRALVAEGAVEGAKPAALDVIINPLATEAEVTAALNALQGAPSVNLETAYQDTGAFIVDRGVPTVGSVKGEWAALGLARAGYDVPDGYFETYLENVTNHVVAAEGALSPRTEYSRIILALTSIGADVSNVGGHNLLEGLADYDEVISQGVNGAVFALLALDSHGYEVPAVAGVDTLTTRQLLIDKILELELDGGGWTFYVYPGATADVDLTAMALQALAPYYASNSAAKAAVDRGLALLSSMQNEDGVFPSAWGDPSAESVSQVITALTALGLDPQTDVRFIKGGTTLLDALLTYYVDGGGFKHVVTGERNDLASEQGYYSLAAYFRFAGGQTSLYNMSDVEIVPATYPVTVNLEPASASIVIMDSEGNTVGTGTSHDLVAGSYSYRAGADGHRAASGSFTVSGAPVTVDVTLEPYVASGYSWTESYRGNSSNMAVVDDPAIAAGVPTTLSESEVRWAASGAKTHAIFVNGEMFSASGSVLSKIDTTNGTTTTATLAGSMGFSYFITSGEGKIFIQEGLRVEAINAADMTQAWRSEPVSGSGQGLTPLYYADGFVYGGTTQGTGTVFFCMSAADGSIVWEVPWEKNPNTGGDSWSTSGHYWAGANVIGDYCVFGGESGVLRSVNKLTGETVDVCNTPAGHDIRSSIAYAGGDLYFTVKQGGLLYKVDFDESSGQLGSVTSAKIDPNATETISTPVVHDGRVYVSASTNTATKAVVGVLSASDLSHIYSVPLAADAGTATKGHDVLLVVDEANDCVYGYTTHFWTPGSITGFRDAAGQTTPQYVDFSSVTQSVAANYGAAQVITGPDGTLYFTNDAGKMIALAKNSAYLTALSADTGTLSPAFASGTTTYTVVVPRGTPSVDLNFAAVEGASVEVNGSPGTGSATIALSEGTATATLKVQKGSYSRTYTINIREANDDATLSDLKLSTSNRWNQSLLETTPTFSADTTYVVQTTAEPSRTFINLWPAASDGNASIVVTAGPGMRPGSGSSGDPIPVTGTNASRDRYAAYFVTSPQQANLGTVTVEVTAEDGTTTKAYTVVLVKNADTAAPLISDVEASGLTVTVTATDDNLLAPEAYSFDGGESWQASNEKTFAEAGTLPAGTIRVRDAVLNVAEHGEDVVLAPAVDKAALNEAIATAQGKQQADYTPASWQALETALAAAQAVADDPDATQAQVDEATANLNAAIDGLMANPGEPIDVTVRFQKDATGFVVAKQNVELETDLSERYGYVDAYRGGEATALDALVRAHIAVYGDEPANVQSNLTVTSQGYVTRVMGVSTSNFSYYVNGKMPGDGVFVADPYMGGTSQTGYAVSQALLEDKDNTSFVVLQDDWTMDTFGWFEAAGERTEQVSVTAGENLDLTLKGYMNWYGLSDPEWQASNTAAVEGASVVLVAVNGGAGTFGSSMATTNAEGQATVSFTEPGTYVVSATISGWPPLISPWLTVTVTVPPADKAALNEAIATAQGKQEADYTPASWQALETALAAAQAVADDPDATQAQVDEATANLNAAIDGLVLKADKAALNEAIATAQGKQQADYTPASWQALETALAAAQAVADDPDATQAQVDEATANLNAAIDGLMANPGEPIDVTVRFQKDATGFVVAKQNVELETDLSERYGYVDAYRGGEATALDALVRAHIAVYGDEPANVQSNLTVTSQGYVTRVMGVSTSNFSYYVNGKMPGDGVFVADPYMGGTSQTGYAVSQALLEDKDNTSFVVLQDDWTMDTFGWFEAAGERTEQVSVTAGENLDLTLKGYMNWYGLSDPEWQASNTAAVEGASVVLVAVNGGAGTFGSSMATTNAEGQATVSFTEPGTYVVSATISGWPPLISPWLTVTVTVPPADKAALNEAIATAQGKQEADYTPASWQALETALAAAQAVADDPDATQAQVDEATANLNAAIDGLVLKADKAALNEAIATAQGKQQADYTPASWQALETALAAAQAVADDPDATQAQVDEATANLNAAIDGLVLKADIKVTKVDLPSRATVKEGENITLEAEVYPDDATDKSLTWRSCNTRVATVDEDGVVTGVRPGKAWIVATANDGSGKWDKCRVTVKSANVKVTKVDLPSRATVKAGQSITLTAEVYPDDATDKSLTWRSCNTRVATVDEDGVVTGVRPGKAWIVATANDGSGKWDKCRVTVKSANVKVTKVDLPSRATVKAGQSITLTAQVYPDDATDKSLTWRSCNPWVATVDEDGVVTGVRPGKVWIIAVANDGSGKWDSCRVTVDLPSRATVKAGQSITLTAEVDADDAADATDKSLTWRSSNTRVATVDKYGVVTGLRPGKVRIIATTKNGSGKWDCCCKVTVK